MNLRSYLDATYLKTHEQAKVSEIENRQIVQSFVAEAIHEKFKLIMIRPEQVAMAKKQILEAQSEVLVGTVIDFPEGEATVDSKLIEAKQAIANGADELDFVCNYKAFKNGNIEVIKEEIYQGTLLALTHKKGVKWIIEVAALSNNEIISLTSLIKNVVVQHFQTLDFASVFVKSSTGFYVTENNSPNGATIESIKLMLEYAAPLSVKAAGGVRNYNEALEMILLGVRRIGTSGAKAIVDGASSQSEY